MRTGTVLTSNAFVCPPHLLLSAAVALSPVLLVAAIANYTTRVVTKSLGAEQVQEALKFIGMFL